MPHYHIPFFKYQGTGNDFIILDGRTRSYNNILDSEQIRQLCSRRFGIGADGLIILVPSEQADFRMIYFNSDGKESSMCGNGGRCIVAFARRIGMEKRQFVFEAIDGLHEGHWKGDGIVSLKMIQPYGYQRFTNGDEWIHTGSPHYIRFTKQLLDEVDMVDFGRKIRFSPQFKQEGTNVNLVNVKGANRLQVRTYERGVEDETFSCGTGVVACAYTYLQAHKGIPQMVEIETKGGKLGVELRQAGTEEEAVWLSGPATFVFKGEIVVEK